MQFPDATEANAQMLIPNVAVGDDPYRYFENLASYVNYEYVSPEDKAFLGMLQSLGIEKGRPFAPDERMKNILRKASIVGYNMSRVNLETPKVAEAIDAFKRLTLDGDEQPSTR